MRDTSYWRKNLEKQLANAWQQQAQLRIGSFLDIELGLWALSQLLPGEPASGLWVILTGYPFAEGSAAIWGDEQHQMLASLRHLLPFYRSRRPWRLALADYRTMPQELRGYDIDTELSQFQQRTATLATKRWQTYAKVLQQPPPHKRTSVCWAPAGHYTFLTDHYRASVSIPNDLPLPPHPQPHPLDGSATRPSYTITLDELRQTAAWMDEQLQAQGEQSTWAQRITRVGLTLFNHDRSALADSASLTIKGMTHLVGMVGAGKSTLMDIAAVCLAQRGLHITLVVGDVISALDRAMLFRRLGLDATPILGRSNHVRHLRRLHRSCSSAEGADELAMGHLGFRWLSSACPLDGLRDEARPIALTQRPCIGLVPVAQPNESSDSQEREETNACPLYGGCAFHQAQRDLPTSQIWIATPASLMFTGVAPQVNRQQVRFAELVVKRSDVVIVDEADRVQMQLDSIFSPSQNLISRSPEAWLNKLNQTVTQQISLGGRGQLADKRVARWVQAHDMVQLAASRVYALLLQSEDLPKTLGQSYFTGWLLFEQLAQTIASYQTTDEEKKATYEQLMALFNPCADDPLGEQAEHALADLARRNIVSITPDQITQELATWVQEQLAPQTLSEARIKALAEQFALGLATAVLSNRLDVVTSDWRFVEAPLHLEEAGSMLFHTPPADYSPEVPVSPMGNVLAFQYIRSIGEKDQAGDLRFFRCMGVGRWFLLNLHTRFRVDKHAGPHVLLLSATSWAGTSPSFDLQVPVTGVLRVPDAEVASIRQSLFEYLPVLDRQAQPIRISGRRGTDRMDALRLMLAQLTRRSTLGGTSLIEQIRDQLPQGRRRMLLVVGSYEEAEAARTMLDQLRPDWVGQVMHLVPDDAGNGPSLDNEWIRASPGLQRGVIYRFGASDAWILIAPLLAVERGHNILNQDQQAAIGAAFFLIRPHLRPDDITFAIHSINRWAVETFQIQPPLYQHAAPHVEQHAQQFRRLAFSKWLRFIHLPMIYSTLPSSEHRAVTWEHLVAIWQVIGRLVRGGVPAQVYFCDSAFAPIATDADTPGKRSTSLLLSMIDILTPYFDPNTEIPPPECELAQMLYGPFYQALKMMRGIDHGI